MSEWPQPGQRLQTTVAGPAGALDALAECPDERPRAVAVVCHPHPQHGGAKTNKVAYTLARAAVQSGCAAVRFDFRGVGASEGGFDHGVGEVDDVLAVAEWARRAGGCQRLVLAGFSFGAAVAVRAAMQASAKALVTVALPTVYFDGAVPRPDCPWLALHGDADDVADPGVARDALQGLSPAPEWVLLAGVGHFFHGRLSDLRDTTAARLGEWLEPPR